MKLTSLTLLIALFSSFGLFWGASARADEIRIKNGDRLSGEIVRMERDKLIFKPSYVEAEMTIFWPEVLCIDSLRPLPLEFRDQEFLIATISCPQEGMIQAESPTLGPSRPLPLQELQAINPSTYSGLLTLGTSLNSGNTETRAVSLSTQFQVRTRKHRFTVNATHNYAEANGETTARNSSGSLKYDFFTSEKVYSYAQSLTEQDALANLNLRNTEGLGFGYNFFDTRPLSLYAEAGLSFFNEDVKIGEDRRDAAGRWAAGLDWEPASRHFKLFHRQEGYYSLQHDTVVLHCEQGVRLPLLSHLFATAEFAYRFNSSPETGKKRSDISLNFGLTYEYAYW